MVYGYLSHEQVAPVPQCYQLCQFHYHLHSVLGSSCGSHTFVRNLNKVACNIIRELVTVYSRACTLRVYGAWCWWAYVGHSHWFIVACHFTL